MPSIELLRVGFAYVESAPVFDALDAEFRPGWTAVVGANGSGKTTLLRILAGEIRPDTGSVRANPRALSLHLCPQRVETITAEIEVFARSTDRTANRLRGQLELLPKRVDRWGELSPGQRKRWQIGAALAADPLALLLDEPTNHLDGEARGLLERALRHYSGIGVLVSHDRVLMNELAERTLRLTARGAVPYAGGYDEARSTWEAQQASDQAAHKKLRTERKKLERRIDDRRRKWDKAASRATTSKRMKSPRDSATRAVFKLTRRRSAENALGREIHKLHGTLDRVDARAAQIQLEHSIGRSLFVNYQPAPVPILAALAEEKLLAGPRLDGRLLQRDLIIQVRRDTRLHLRGSNGTGKTTVLTRLLAAAKISRDRVLYLPQELSAAGARHLLREVRALTPDALGNLLSIVAALGVEPAALLESQQPSPGEARKLALASGLARQVWWLALDEPTNHLDLPSIERLEQALADYPGAIVLATHDDRFADRVTTSRIDLSAPCEAEG